MRKRVSLACRWIKATMKSPADIDVAETRCTERNIFVRAVATILS